MTHLCWRLRGVWTALSGLAILASASIAAAQSRPNIVVLFSDDAGYADFGFQNQFSGQTTEFKTPNLDALAQQSVVFSNAYVTSSVCSASRAGLLTGRYNSRFGVDYVFANTTSLVDGIPANEVLMSEALKQAGYATGAIGKWHVGINAAQQPVTNGFDYFFGILEGGRPYFGVPHPIQVRRGSTAVSWATEASFNNVPADPTNGRYLTDAWGDEASQYIAEHANQAEPFFLYTAFNAPHSPYDVHKASDIAEFNSTSLTGLRKNVAASTFAMDRAIGNILGRLNDPNGDGNTSDSIADNTIVVFANDNGGAPPSDPLANGEMVHSNAPLTGYKGSGFEGGLRTPMMIRAPGVDPGVINEVVSTLDLFPTFLAAAGAAPTTDLDGVNLLPFLEGVQTGEIRDKTFWRAANTYFAYRQGEWKLTRPGVGLPIALYRLNPNGTGEGNVAGANPEIYQQMIKDFVDWEATLAKPTQKSNFVFNRFDAFRFRTVIPTVSKWRDTNAWVNDANPAEVVSIKQEDSYANAVLVFHPRNDADYTSENNFGRSNGLSLSSLDGGQQNPDGFREFMLSELQFGGEFGGAANRSGTLFGLPLLFVKNLSGAGPRIVLNSTATVANKFTFHVNMDVVLHADLEITGNSTQNLTIGGIVRDFDEPRSLTKTGTSAITLSGANTYFGQTLVNGGTLRVDGPNAALENTSAVSIGAQGTLALVSGRIHTPALSIAAGGNLQFTGGILETAQVTGNLVNNGGAFRPGLSTAITNISGDFTQTAGSLVVELGGLTAGTQYDRLVAGDDVTLGGALEVSLINAFSPALGSNFEIIRATDLLAGTFSSVTAPALSGGRKWALQQIGSSMWLSVVAGLAADFDDNNVVNAADLVVWRGAAGTSALGDADGDGDTDGADLLIWQRQVGARIVGAGAAAATIPEPSGLALTMIGALGVAAKRALARAARR